MQLSTLKDLLEEQIKDIYHAEMQLVQVIPRFTKKVASDELHDLFERHMAETERQIERLEQISKRLRIELSGKKCVGMEGLIAEATEVLLKDGSDAVLDLAVSVVARSIEHYQISAYRTALDLAEAMGDRDVVRLLDESLREEEQAEQSFTVLSEDIIDSVSVEAKATEYERLRPPAS